MTLYCTWSRKYQSILLNQAILRISLTKMEVTDYQAIYIRCVGACWCDICEVGELAFVTVAHMHSTIQHDVFTPCKNNKKTKLFLAFLFLFSLLSSVVGFYSLNKVINKFLCHYLVIWSKISIKIKANLQYSYLKAH